MTIFQGINVVSICVADLDEARGFYRDILELGAPIHDLPEAGWIEFSAGAQAGNIALTRAEAGSRPGFGTTIVLNVADCRMAVMPLRARGVRCDDAQDFPGFVTFASFYDPFGNRLQMCSPAPT